MVHGVSFQKVSDLPLYSEDFSLVAHAVSNQGAGIFLFVESAGKDEVLGTVKQGIGVFPKASIGERKRFALLEIHEGNKRAFELPPLDVTFPLVDVFPDGRVMIAASRSQWRGPDDFDENGVVVDPATGAFTRILLGDGIEHLSIDSLGRIWVAYFDEGVFGNFGWGLPGPEPVGSSGLNCFDANGAILWRFIAENDFGPIDDCYAMNVFGDTAWIYFCSAFALCRVSRDFDRRLWKTGLAGCHHFAIAGSSVLFSGQYDDGPAVGYLGRLGDGKVEDIRQVELTLPDGTPISSGRLVASGGDLHYFDDSGCYKTGPIGAES